jgi:membrane-bound metal-dependent hydrolase YbcI (DUF457 family)
MRVELWAILHFWDEFICAALYGFVGMSCLLWINDLCGRGHWGLKAVLYVIGGGAFAGMVSPFFRDWKSPTVAEILFLAGVAIIFVGMTTPQWRELVPRIRRYRRHVSQQLHF